LQLRVETIRRLDPHQLAEVQGGFAGPSHDEYGQHYNSCSGCTTTVSLF
jgi:hypothetical protein